MTTNPAQQRARTLADVVADVAVSEPDHPALIFDDVPIGYGQLDALIERTADRLVQLGVAPGERVALWLGNRPEFVHGFYAVLRLGGVVVPLSPAYTVREASEIVANAGAVGILTTGEHAAAAHEVSEQCASVRWSEDMTGTPDAGGGAAPRPARPVVRPEQLAVLGYTSGSTGRPKGVMLTHANLIANCEQLRERREPQTDPERVLLVAPVFHIMGLNAGLNSTLFAGGTVVLMTRFDARQSLAAIVRHKITQVPAAPPMFVAWNRLADLARYDLSSVRSVSSGSAPLPMPVRVAFERATGLEIREAYGMTEAGPTTHSNSVSLVNKPGTVGPPLPGVESAILDPTGAMLPVGQPGELAVRGPNVTAGYWGQPEATAHVLTDGWLRTGDEAIADEDGYVRIVGRLKDMINAGGFKVWPQEVEEVLDRHPGVRESAVVGTPDDYAGERPVAFVVSAVRPPPSPDELAGYCRARLAAYKVPIRFEYCDALPHVSTGKLARGLLRAAANRPAPAR